MTKRQTFSVERLKKYCEEHEIAIPKTASRAQIEAAIARSYLHMNEASPHPTHGCLGFYSDSDMNCLKFCEFKSECFRSSIGLDEKKCKKFEKVIIKVRFSEPLRRKK